MEADLEDIKDDKLTFFSKNSFNQLFSEQTYNNAQVKGDVVLVPGGGDAENFLRVDSTILAAASHFFKTVLRTHHNLCLDDDIMVLFPDFSHEEIEEFVRFIYYGRGSLSCGELLQYLSSDLENVTAPEKETREEISENKENIILSLKDIKRLVNSECPDICYVTLDSETKTIRDNFKGIRWKGDSLKYVKCNKCDAVVKGPDGLKNPSIYRHLKVHNVGELEDEPEICDIELNSEDVDRILPDIAPIVNVIVSNDGITVDDVENDPKQISKVLLEKLIELKSPRVNLITNTVNKATRSQVWDRFYKVEVDGELVNFVTCMSCSKVYLHESTTSLLRHVCKKSARINKVLSSKETIKHLIKTQSTRIEFCPPDIRLSSLVADLDHVFQRIKVDRQKSRFLRCVHCDLIFSFGSFPSYQGVTKQLEDHECYIKYAPCYQQINLQNIQPNNEQDLRIINIRHPDRIKLTNKVVGKQYLYHLEVDNTASRYIHCVKCRKFISMETINENTGRGHTCHKQKSTLSAKNMFKCEICDLEVKSRHFLEIHMRQIHEEGTARVLCSFCGKDFATDNLAKKHENQSHNPDSRKFKCEEEGCMMSFHDRHKLNQHAKIHYNGKKPHVCDLCGKDFNWLSSFRDHMDMHNGVKKFHCHFCGKSFTKRNTYNNHRRLHTGEKPFMCPVSECGMSFVQRTACKTHARKKHNILITEYTRNPNVEQSESSRAQTRRKKDSQHSKDGNVEEDKADGRANRPEQVVEVEHPVQVSYKNLTFYKSQEATQMEASEDGNMKRSNKRARVDMAIPFITGQKDTLTNIQYEERETINKNQDQVLTSAQPVQLAKLQTGQIPVRIAKLQPGNLIQTAKLQPGNVIHTAKLQPGNVIHTAKLPAGNLVQTGKLEAGNVAVRLAKMDDSGASVELAQLPQGQIVHIIPIQSSDLSSLAPI